MTTQPEDQHDSVQDTATEQAASMNPRIHLGERLSQARQARDISISDASDRLRIRGNYLDALESGDWGPLPEEVYVMGFLRQYASLLGIDISSDIEALKTSEYQLTKPFTMPDPPIAMNRTWAIVASACFVLLLILFNVVDEGEKDQVPPRAPGTISLASPEPASDESTDESSDTSSDASTRPEQQPQAAAESVADIPVAATTGTTSREEAESTAIATPPNAVQAIVQKQVAPVAAAPDQPLASESNVASSPRVVSTISHDTGTAQQNGQIRGAHDYSLSAFGEDVWLQVHAPDGSLIKEALLRSGQSMRLSSNAAYLLLTAGNPLALKISIDDRHIAEPGTLGEKEKVLHDYRLTPPETGRGD
ncbi:MAG: DUF4115 domain-containing protein [Mariprofundaceae bacterium]|nr:DUF4115 domain-containing protein [Mariprofundaceae bacterium]